MNPFEKPILAVVVGANRGYGYEIAEALMLKVCEGSVVVITGRKGKALKEAAKSLKAKGKRSNVELKVFVADLGCSKENNFFIENALDGIDTSNCCSAILFNNAATLGDVKLKLEQHKDTEYISKYMDVNVSSALAITAQFLEAFSMKLTTFVVNISSLCAIAPIKGMGLYCTGKAARDMMFKVLAEERKDIRVLNWAPGPMETDMTSILMDTSFEETSNMFRDLRKNNNFVPLSSSVKKLMQLLEANTFESGKHIDYYDV